MNWEPVWRYVLDQHLAIVALAVGFWRLRVLYRATAAARDSAEAARVSADAAQGGLRHGHRAWVCVTEVKVKRRDPSPMPAQIIVTAVNSGRSPALETRFAAKCEIGDTPTGESEITGDTSRAPIGPGADLQSLCGRSYESKAQVDAINEGLQALFVSGMIEYADIFGTEHRTRFCFRYEPVSQEFIAHSEGNFMD